MKKIILSFVAVLFSVVTFAQVNLWSGSRVIYKADVAKIDSITFGETNAVAYESSGAYLGKYFQGQPDGTDFFLFEITNDDLEFDSEEYLTGGSGVVVSLCLFADNENSFPKNGEFPILDPESFLAKMGDGSLKNGVAMPSLSLQGGGSIGCMVTFVEDGDAKGAIFTDGGKVTITGTAQNAVIDVLLNGQEVNTQEVVNENATYNLRVEGPIVMYDQSQQAAPAKAPVKGGRIIVKKLQIAR